MLSAITTLFGSATPCSRAARLGGLIASTFLFFTLYRRPENHLCAARIMSRGIKLTIFQDTRDQEENANERCVVSSSALVDFLIEPAMVAFLYPQLFANISRIERGDTNRRRCDSPHSLVSKLLHRSIKSFPNVSLQHFAHAEHGVTATQDIKIVVPNKSLAISF